MRIARVIMTWDCRRDCDLCCNKNLPVQPKSCRVSDLAGYDQVLITGGEPLLYPEKLVELITALRAQTPKSEQKIFLYTAMYRPALNGIAGIVDGVHFTLHHPVRPADLRGLRNFQELLRDYKDSGRSFRLYIEPRVKGPVEIYPHLWAKIEVKPWLDACPMPPNEELFVLG